MKTVAVPMLAGCVLLAAAAFPNVARACRYCQQGADPVEVMRFQGLGRNTGSFPLDDSLNNLGTSAPAVPPAVVTRAAELPARPAAVIVPVSAPVVTPAPAPAPVAVSRPAMAPASTHWADLGLLGLAGLGGLFVWRTRAAKPMTAA